MGHHVDRICRIRTADRLSDRDLTQSAVCRECISILALLPLREVIVCLIRYPCSGDLRRPRPNRDDGQWTMATKDYGNVRYSGLDQINTDNAKNLKLAWTFSTGVFRGQEAAPLVVGDTMYVVTPFPNYLYRAGSEQTRHGEVEIRSQARRRRQGRSLLRLGEPRRVPIADGRIFYNTARRQHRRGRCRHRQGSLEDARSATSTRAKRSPWRRWWSKGKSTSASAAANWACAGRLTCLDASDGKILWRAWSTGPDADCLIGPQFKPYYDIGQGQGPGREDLAAGPLENRRRHDLGIPLLRPGNQPDLLRHRQSRELESRSAPRRQQVDLRHVSPATPTPARPSGSTRPARTMCSITTASTSACCWI